MGRKGGKKKRRNAPKGSRPEFQPPSSPAVDDEIAHLRIRAGGKRPNLRFKVGDRVECLYGPYELGDAVDEEEVLWQSGTVEQLWWAYSLLDIDYVAPYQVKLDDGPLIYAPHDDDTIVKLEPVPSQLRFRVGDRVECHVAPEEEGEEGDSDSVSGVWVPGTVIKLWYDADDPLRQNYNVPYQVLLDTGRRVFAPNDAEDSEDICIRSSSAPVLEVAFAKGARIECKVQKSDDEWRLGTVVHSNKDWAKENRPPYYIRFDNGEYYEFWGPQDCIRESSSLSFATLNLDDDDDLFSPPPRLDCPICFLPVPIGSSSCGNLPCCGHLMCSGCDKALRDSAVREGGALSCPYCRTQMTLTDEELVALIRKRVNLGDAEQTFVLGYLYESGTHGLSKDEQKALELYSHAAELGSPRACTKIARMYGDGDSVLKDEPKQRHYLERAARLGDLFARHTLGHLEQECGNAELAFKHWKVSAVAGYRDSLADLRYCYMEGMMSKEEYAGILRDNQRAEDEMASKERNAATESRSRETVIDALREAIFASRDNNFA